MAATRIELTPEAIALLQKMSRMQDIAVGAIAQALDEQNALTVSHIQRAYLSFPKGSAPVPIGLRVQSNRLRESVNAAPATQVGLRVNSGIGSNVVYARVHEFGGDVQHAPRTGWVRLRTTTGGALLGQKANARLAVFAKKSHKQVRFVQYKSQGYTVHMPERAPIRRGIVDRLKNYGRAVGRKLKEAWSSQ
ncbi:MAG: hypothetical protein ABFD89_05190 [Bryobacteraceae bacterium]